MMKNTIRIIIAFIVLLPVISCAKGKACLCEKYDRETGEYESSKYSEDFETCTGASFVLSNEDDYFDYYCYDYYQNN